jgi:hypothetical protein
MNGNINQDTWYPVILTDERDFKTGITGKIYSDITCKYFKTGSTSQTSFSVTNDNWKEAGEGKYSIKMGVSEWTEQTIYQVSVVCAGCIVYNFPVDTQLLVMDPQVIRDAMAIDLSGTITPSSESIDQHLDDILALVGGFFGSVEITMHLQDAGAVPILGGSIQVFDSNMLKLQTAGNSNVDGNLIITLNPGDYKVLISKQGIYTFDVPASITVTTSATFTFVGSEIPPIPPAANCQLVYIYPIDVGNVIATTVYISIEPQNENEIISPYFLIHKKVIMEYSTERLRFEANIIKNSNVIIEGKTNGEQFLYGSGQIDSDNSKNLIDYDWINN